MQGLSITSEEIFIASNYDYIQNRLERLFFLESEEIPGFFNSGSKIMELFYEPLDATTVNGILFEIKRLISLYEPDICIQKIGAGVVPLNAELMLLIELDYTTIKNPNNVKTVSIQKIRTLGDKI